MLNGEINSLAEKNKAEYNAKKKWDWSTGYLIKRPAMKDILEKIKPKTCMEDFKRVFTKKTKIILGPLMMKECAGEPTLQDALVYLGQATARLAMLEELHGLIQHMLYTNSPVWPQELWDLRELTKKQEANCIEMVKAFLFQADKEQQEADKLPTVKDVDWK